MAESYSVMAILSAEDNMSSALKKASGATQSFGQKLKSATGLGAAMQLGMRGVNAAINAVTGSMGSAVARFDTLNNFPKIMANMKISSEDAAAALNKASKEMAKLPTSLDDAASGIQRFTSKNGDIKKSTDYFLALNNAVIAGGQSTQVQSSALEQLSQAYSKGKMDMMEWRALQQAMPAQLNQIAKAMGTTTDALGEGLRKGTISMDDFMDMIVKLNEEGVDGFASFKDQAESACDGIQTAIANVKTAISRGLANTLSGIDAALKSNGLMTIGQAINSIIPAIDKVSEKVVRLTQNLGALVSGKMSGEGFGKMLGGMFGAALTDLTNFANQIVGAIPGIASTLVNVISGLFPTIASTIFKKIGELAKTILPAVTELINSLAETLPGLVTTVITSLVNTLTTQLPVVLETILANIPNIIDAGSKLLGGLIDGIIAALPTLVATVPKLITTIVTGIVSHLPQILASGANLLLTFDKGILSLKGSLISTAKGIAAQLPKAFLSILGSVVSAGANIMKGLWNGIKGLKDWVISKVKGIGKSILNGLKSALGIHSPSREFAKIGVFSGLGLIEGLDSMQKRVTDAASNLMELPTRATAMSGGLALSGDYNYGYNGSYEIVVPLAVDGKEFARATSSYTQSELNRKQQIENRKSGRI